MKMISSLKEEINGKAITEEKIIDEELLKVIRNSFIFLTVGSSNKQNLIRLIDLSPPERKNAFNDSNLRSDLLDEAFVVPLSSLLAFMEIGDKDTKLAACVRGLRSGRFKNLWKKVLEIFNITSVLATTWLAQQTFIKQTPRSDLKVMFSKFK